MDSPVLVVPRKSPGFQGDPRIFPMPPVYNLAELEDALSKTYPYDAHLALYYVEGEEKCPRIKKTGYQYLADNGKRVLIDKVFIDVDNPNHAPWDHISQIEKVHTMIRATELGKNAGFYATRHGYRLFWKLPQPMEAIYYESFVEQLIERLMQDGISADTGCTDWTRLFRLPFATPEGEKNHISLPYDFEHGVISWQPKTLQMGKMPKILAGVADNWPLTAPVVVPPEPHDYALLKGEAELFNRVKKGEPLADMGGRYNTMLRAVGILANKLDNPTPEGIYRALSYSVEVDKRQTPHNGPPPTVQALWDACKAICAVVISERRENEEQTRKIVELAVRRDEEGRRNNVHGLLLDSDKESEGGSAGQDIIDGEIEPPDDFADAASVVPLRQRCVLFTTSRTYYVLNQRTTLYHGPFEATGLPAMIEKYCPNIADRIRNEKTGALLSTAEILSRYGTEVDRCMAFIGKKGIKFNVATKTIEEGVAAIRKDLKPVFHQEIDIWLRKFGGSHAEKLLDWLATFIELQSPTCGLYLKSPGGTGKGLLASGLARLWGTAPTMYANIIGTHNDGIAICPLIWGDEEIPPSQYGKTPSAVFRTLVGNSEFNLRRMYAPVATIKGCLRLLVTANNNNALKIEEDLSPDDYQAIVQRIGYIQVPDEARIYLESLGGRSATASWVDGDGIAEHVLWLAKNRVVQRGPRFLVTGWESTMHKHLQVTSGVAGLVVEVIAHALSSAKTGYDFPKGFVVGNDHIYVSVMSVVNNWEAALGEKSRVASKNRIQASLIQLSAQSEMVKVEVDNGYDTETLKMWALRPKEILEAIDQYQLGDADMIADRIRNNVVRVR